MRQRGWLLRSVCVYSVLLIVSFLAFLAFVNPVHASALSDGRWLSTSESVQVFGSSFEVTYYNGVDYVTTTASYTDGTRSLRSAAGEIPAGVECLQYTAPVVDLNYNPQYITCDIRPQYSVFGTSQVHTALFAYCTNPASVPPYQSPDWRWMVSGSEQIFTGSVTNGEMDKVYVASDPCIYINVDIDSQSTFTASSVRATFVAPLSVYSGKLYFYLAPVYVSTDADASNGIQTTVTTGQNQGGSNVDLSETNGLLDVIADAIGGLASDIVDGVIGIFVPEQNILETFENDLAELLQDTFGGIDNDMLVDVIADLLTHGATESVTFPAIDVPNTNFHLPSYSVPLKPNSVGLHSFYESIALALDLVATCAVLNLIMENIKTFLVGEKVVDIQNAD